MDLEAGREAGREIEDERRHVIERAGGTFEKIAREFVTIAFSDVRDYVRVDEGGAIQAIPLDQMVRRKSRAIKKIKEHTQIKESADGTSIFKDSRIEYELYDKMDALKYLCKLRGDEPAQKLLHGGKVETDMPSERVRELADMIKGEMEKSTLK